jgi:alkanesulfonate monooxygenase SsuD/methylene tetrahydromethanopterin reductase-like flavin-dependent oxidoreductase (luciferase family)
MFGIEQREHDTRYDYGQEWWDVVQKIWAEPAAFDYSGRFIKLKSVVGKPKPYRWRPVVMNAGSSGAGRAFAAKNCDFQPRASAASAGDCGLGSGDCIAGRDCAGIRARSGKFMILQVELKVLER